MPRGVGEWTVDDVDALPDDGLQYELVDGMLLVTPAPTPRHQLALMRLLGQLHDAAQTADALVLPAPVDWRPHRRTSLQPDIVVLRRADYDPERLTPDLLLAVEILSPSTRRKDQLLKRSAYEDAGVASYWMVDPAVPSIVALDLVDGRYVVTGEARGNEEVHLERPIPVTLVPTDLLRP
ncbi:MAG: Uma2 family endonuclease [Actinobacteria bacterium]|nr:Uma2 family endonuclease [Actinomycetota bacterium]